MSTLGVMMVPLFEPMSMTREPSMLTLLLTPRMPLTV
jgi:hypothetical protein